MALRRADVLVAHHLTGHRHRNSSVHHGSASGELACIMRVGGKRSVAVERLPELGESTGRRTCPNDGNDDNIRSCTAFSGEFWFAVGSGWCERKTWESWEARWVSGNFFRAVASTVAFGCLAWALVSRGR